MMDDQHSFLCGILHNPNVVLQDSTQLCLALVLLRLYLSI